MEDDLKRFLGQILGELYRLQRQVEPKMCPVAPSTSFAMVQGIDFAVDEHFELYPGIGRDQYEHTIMVLSNVDPTQFKGFYDIEEDLAKGGVRRGEAMVLFRYLECKGMFLNLLQKMDSQHSPGELRTFKLEDDQK